MTIRAKSEIKTHPKLIGLGGKASGCDWLQYQFDNHKDFWAPPLKEISFFDRNFGPNHAGRAEKLLARMMPQHGALKADYKYDISFLLRVAHGQPRPRKLDFDAYFALFEEKPGLVADCSTGYTQLGSEMASEMLRQMPDTGFVLMLRDPVTQVWAMAQKRVRNGRTPDWKVTTVFDHFKEFVGHKSVQRAAHLGKVVDMWRSLDKNGQFLVVTYDELIADPKETRSKIAEHIGVDIDGFDVSAAMDDVDDEEMPEEFHSYLLGQFASA